jgi:hypothetical protein
MPLPLTRVYCRSHQFSADIAQKLGVPGVGQYQGKEKVVTLTYELNLEWGQPDIVRTPRADGDGNIDGIEIKRVGQMAWIRLIVNVYSDHHDLKVDLYTVGLEVTAGTLHAQRTFEAVNLPSSVQQLLPAPSTWADFNDAAYNQAYQNIASAQQELSKAIANGFVPGIVEKVVDYVPNPTTQLVKSAVFGLDGMAVSACGRVLWDVEAAAERKKLDPELCRRVYGMFGVPNRWVLPTPSVHKKAAEWAQWIRTPAP